MKIPDPPAPSGALILLHEKNVMISYRHSPSIVFENNVVMSDIVTSLNINIKC